MFKKMISKPVDWAVYSLLGEKQRKQIGDLMSKEQKEKVVRLLNGKKFLQRKKLKALKHHLYTLGFTDRALNDMQEFLETAENNEIRRLISWEMSLWYANRNDAEGARTALDYLPTAAEGEQNPDQLRRIAIVTAECFARLGEKGQASALLLEHAEQFPHPDLHLGLANLEDKIEAKMTRINKAFAMHQLNPIGFKTDYRNATYDDLTTLDSKKAIHEGPLVSVILPAYKAEAGVRVAIESILNQTWQNLELIVVDDCSPDNTSDTVREYVGKDSRVKLLSTPKNSGPYVARNIALENARGTFVTVNDADDWSHSEKLEIQVRHLMDNPKVIANTSEHARLTEAFNLYRRGTPGKYIFPNMSSIMFRREPVVEKIGYWDSVRFAADGEFKRRLLKVFGPNSYVDLKTGPLSLPRQSESSLTGSSAFGYDGFFMGVRKEYVEGLEHHHDTADTLYYPHPQPQRPFPVPEPMWPEREEKMDGYRTFDVVLAADFRLNSDRHVERIERLRAEGMRVGLMQLYRYDLEVEGGIDREVREMLDGENVQSIVYGEHIKVRSLIIAEPETLMSWQKYRPEVIADEILIEAAERFEDGQIERVNRLVEKYFDAEGTWLTVRSRLQS